MVFIYIKLSFAYFPVLTLSKRLASRGLSGHWRLSSKRLKSIRDEVPLHVSLCELQLS